MNKIIVLFVILIFFGSAAVHSYYRNGLSSLHVETTLVGRGILSDTILTSGNLKYRNQILIRSDLTGRIEDVHVEEGDNVKKDQLLIKLNSKNHEAEVKKATSIVERLSQEIKKILVERKELQRQLNLQKRLVKQDAGRQADVKNLQNQLELSEIEEAIAMSELVQGDSNLTIATENLRKTNYVSPIDGVLIKLEAKKGETVLAGDVNAENSTIMTIADTSTILADLRVDEADIANVHINQSALIFVSAYPRMPVKGKVISIAHSARADEQGHGKYFKVNVLLENNDKLKLYSGMSVRGELVVAQKDTELRIPLGALRSDDIHSFVWVVENGMATRKDVTLGLSSDLFQEILSGLNHNDQVIIGPGRAIEKLTDGTAVTTLTIE